jgi:hypothetical protein
MAASLNLQRLPFPRPELSQAAFYCAHNMADEDRSSTSGSPGDVLYGGFSADDVVSLAGSIESSGSLDFAYRPEQDHATTIPVPVLDTEDLKKISTAIRNNNFYIEDELCGFKVRGSTFPIASSVAQMI